MSGTGPLITATLEKIRGYLDDATSDQKYNDAYVLEQFLMPAIEEVQGRLSLTDGNPIVMPYQFNLVVDQREYVMPPSLRKIVRLLHLEQNTNNIIADIMFRPELHPYGPNVGLKGNVLRFNFDPKATDLIELRYVHNGDMAPHYSAVASPGTLADYTTNGNAQRVALAATPTTGLVDRRTNAYAGQILRLVPATGEIEERIIVQSYIDSGTWYVEVANSFSGATGSVAYEIIPYGFGSIWEAMSARASIKLATFMDVTGKQMNFLEREYGRTLKTALDNVSFIVGRDPPTFDGPQTIDNPNYWVLGDSRV